MGLFDGATHPSVEPGFASTAHVAALLRAPVVLVVDASSQARSVAALVHGFATFDPSVRIGGVVLNRVGSDRHEAILREALGAAGVPVLGAIRRLDQLHTPSRHLGLVPAAERSAEALATVDRLAHVVADGVDLDAVLALAATAPPLHAQPWEPAAEVTRAAGRPRIAVAGGPAFTFGYAENAELLAAAGAEVVPVDPLRDEALPEGTSGLVVGGGFPEVYAAELSANETAARRRRRARRPRRPDRRRVRGAAVPRAGAGRRPDVRRAGRRRRRCRRASRSATGPPWHRPTRSSPRPVHACAATSSTGRTPSRVPARPPPGSGRAPAPRASCPAASTLPTCTCTGPARREWPPGSSPPPRGSQKG